MSVQIPPGFAQFSIGHLLSGYTRRAFTVWGVDLGGTGSPDPDVLADQFQTLYADSVGLQIDSSVTISQTRAVVGQDGEPLVGTAVGLESGSASRESAAPALAALVNLNTGLGGRRNRGRKFLPWAVSDQNVTENGTIQTAAVTALQTAVSTFHADVRAEGWEIVVLHGEGSTPIPSPTEVTSLTVSPIISTQRRRQTR